MASATELLGHWLQRARLSAFSHFAAQERFAKLNLFVGLPATVLSAIVGTAVFTSLQNEIDPRIKLLVGFLSILAAVLSALQTFLRFSEISESHRKSATEYSAIRRNIEELIVLGETTSQQNIEQIRSRIDAATQTAPNVSLSIFKSAHEKAGDDYYLSSQAAPSPSQLNPVAGAAHFPTEDGAEKR